MSRSLISERPEWPAVLARLEELARDGLSATEAAKTIAAEFDGFSWSGVMNAMRRGEVPSYPSNDPECVEARKRGNLTYRRYRPCVKCGGRIFRTADNRCRQCEEDWKARRAGRVE